MPYSTASIANALLNRAALDGQKLTHLKLQKLLYFAAGYFQAAYGEPLIDNRFEAWEYGPVVPAIYHEFKHYSMRPITAPALAYDPETGVMSPVPIPTNDPRVEKVIDYVWTTYGKFSAAQLSDMTHRANSPWDRTRKENPGIRNADIPSEYLMDYFGKLVRRPAHAG